MVYNEIIMGSLSATMVAQKVSDNIRRGKNVNLGEIIRSQGYSPSVANAPQRVTNTKSYMAIMKNVVGNMEKQRARMIKALENKNLDREKVATLLSGLDILTKNIQLLSGKATQNVAMVIEVSEAIAKKNASHNSDDVKKDSDNV